MGYFAGAIVELFVFSCDSLEAAYDMCTSVSLLGWYRGFSLRNKQRKVCGSCTHMWEVLLLGTMNLEQVECCYWLVVCLYFSVCV